ncbi:hypothetical protein JCM10212_004033 [Sporobolomyces blumeae]
MPIEEKRDRHGQSFVILSRERALQYSTKINDMINRDGERGWKAVKALAGEYTKVWKATKFDSIVRDIPAVTPLHPKIGLFTQLFDILRRYEDLVERRYYKARPVTGGIPNPEEALDHGADLWKLISYNDPSLKVPDDDELLREVVNPDSVPTLQMPIDVDESGFDSDSDSVTILDPSSPETSITDARSATTCSAATHDDGQEIMIVEDTVMSEKRLGKQRARSPLRPPSRTSSRGSKHRSSPSTGESSTSSRTKSAVVPDVDYRGVPRNKFIEKKGKRLKGSVQTRGIKTNRVRSTFRQTSPKPEPANDLSERRLYRDLFDLDPPSSRKLGATFVFTDFEVVERDNESRQINFLGLLAPEKVSVVGKVVVQQPPRQAEPSEDEDGPTGSLEPPKSHEKYEVRLIGGVDFKRLRIDSKGYSLESRYSTFRFGENCEPDTPYFTKGLVDDAVDLVHCWCLARWNAIRGGFSESPEDAKATAVLVREKLDDEQKRLAEEKKKLVREKRRGKAPAPEWTAGLPKAFRAEIAQVGLPARLEMHLFRLLPDIPFVSPMIYGLVHSHLLPNSLRTHDRLAVEARRDNQLRKERALLASAQAMVSKKAKGGHVCKFVGGAEQFQHPTAALGEAEGTAEEERARNLPSDVYKAIKVNGQKYRSGDVVVVVGQELDGKTIPWFARIVYFLDTMNSTALGHEVEAHVVWFAAAQTINEYASQRHLLELSGRCDTIKIKTIVGKADVQTLRPTDPTPETGFFTRFAYNEVDGSWSDPVKASRPYKRCDQQNLAPCSSCEISLERAEATELGEDSVRRWRPYWITVGDSFSFHNEVYHLGDLVCVEPMNPQEPVYEPDTGARLPLRLARLRGIKCGPSGCADSDELGSDATLEVEWLYRREELATYGSSDRRYGREVVLSSIVEEGIQARRLRGHFRLSHVDTVNALSPDPSEAHAAYARADAFAFWAETTLVATTVKNGQTAEDGASLTAKRVEPVSFEVVDKYGCKRCSRDSKARIDNRAWAIRAVQANRAELAMPYLATYAGAGFLDIGLQSGCPTMTSAYAIEKMDAPAECFKNAHSTTTIIERTVSDVLEAALTSPDELDFSPGDVLALSGGSPCQGFSQANRYQRADCLKILEPFVFLSGLDAERPLHAFFENVAAFQQHALPPSDARSPAAGSFHKLFLAVILELGYQCRWDVYQAAQFGVPQSRRRFIVTAAVAGTPLPAAPVPTHAYRPGRRTDHGIKEARRPARLEVLEPGAPHRAVTIDDATSDLPSFEVDRDRVGIPPGFDWDENGGPAYARELPLTDFQAKIRIDPLAAASGEHVRSTSVTQHVAPAVGPLLTERLLGLGTEREKKHGNYRDLEGSEWFPTLPPFVKRSPKLEPEWYRRLRPNETLATLRTTLNLDGASQGPRIHPSNARSLSIRELMRCQGLPDTVELFFADLGREPTFAEIIRMIGNGVPIPLAEAFGSTLFDSMVPAILDHAASGSSRSSNGSSSSSSTSDSAKPCPIATNIWKKKWDEIGEPLRAKVGTTSLARATIANKSGNGAVHRARTEPSSATSQGVPNKGKGVEQPSKATKPDVRGVQLSSTPDKGKAKLAQKKFTCEEVIVLDSDDED